MKIEIIEKEGKKEENKYPFIGKRISDGMLILFVDEKIGVVIEPPSSNRLWEKGEYFTNFEMSGYEKFEGKVILEND